MKTNAPAISTHRTLSLPIPAPTWWGRAVLMVFTLLLPVIFDLSVPEVAGDIRWAWTTLAASLLGLVGFWAWWESGKPLQLSFNQPVIFWWAALLALWAGISLIDAINPLRGIILIKALYAQLVIMVAVYLLWKPNLTQRLVWMMVLPLAFTSFVGYCQFFLWNDPTFKLMLLNTWGLGWLGAWWPQNGMINWMVTFYQQSAAPGSTFANKNLAGSYTAMMIPLAAYVAFSSKHMVLRALGSLILAMGMLFLVYSRSRASWVALAVGLVVLAFALWLSPAWRALLWQKIRPVTCLLILLPTFVFLGLFGDAKSPIANAHGVNRAVGEQVAALANSSWEEIGGRVAYNLNSLVITKDHWFNGVGLGNFFGIYPAYHEAVIPTVNNSYNIMARPQRTHTDLMQAFTEMGVVGGTAYAAVLLVSLYMAWQLRTPAAVKAVGLFPLFGGLSLFVISLNALMDFPMQLPTAPALACMLMGLMAACYHKAYPNATWAPEWLAKRKVVMARMLIPVFLSFWLAISGWALWDAYWFRIGNQTLKAAMVRMYQGVNDDTTLALLQQANTQYPWDPRIHEHIGVIYANYKGTRSIPLEERVMEMEKIWAGDPWGANHLVNLSGQYLVMAENYINAGNMLGANKALARVEELYTRLQRVGGFSHYTWGVGGMLRLLQGRDAEAMALMEKAIAIEPTYAPAVHGLHVARARLGIGTPATPTAANPVN